MVPHGLIIENRVNRAVPSTITNRRNPNASGGGSAFFEWEYMGIDELKKKVSELVRYIQGAPLHCRPSMPAI